MVNANARVYLEWSEHKRGGGVERLRARGIVYIDHLDRLAVNAGAGICGVHNLAMIQCHWGKFYQSLVRRLMDGRWKKEERGSSAVNYWWGIHQEMVDVLCSRLLPSGTRRLAGVLRDALRADEALAKGLHTHEGALAHAGTAEAHGLELTRTATLLG